MTKRFLFFLVILVGTAFFVFGQADFYQGERLYELKCGRCHLAYAPDKYSFEEWKTLVNEMGPLAGLNEEAETLILDFLKQEAATKEPGALPTSPVLAGYIYTEYFSGKDIVDTFDVHYLNVAIAGRLHERLSYRAEFEFEHGGGEGEPPFVEQAFMDIWLLRNAGLRIGAILAPFNRFDDFHAPLENLLVTRPQVSREIGVSAWKEVGVNLHGHLFVSPEFYLNYDLYAINGLGAGSRLRSSRHYRDNNDAKSLGFRLSGVFSDRFEAGASYSHGAWDDDGEYDLNMYGLHFLGKIEELSLYAEYAKAQSENPSPFDRGEADGFFVQASYLIDGKFRPTVRYEALDYLDSGALLGRKPTDKDVRIIALGLNYYLTRGIVFKVEYDFVREGGRKSPADNDLLAFQAAFRF